MARAISPAAEIVGEFVGRANFANIVTPGAEDRGLLRFGARYTIERRASSMAASCSG